MNRRAPSVSIFWVKYRRSLLPKESQVRRALGSQWKAVIVPGLDSRVSSRHAAPSKHEHSLLCSCLYAHRVTGTPSRTISTHLYPLVVFSSPSLVSFICSWRTAGRADEGRIRPLYLGPSASAVVIRCMAGVTVCSSAPCNLESTPCSGQGPAEQPRSTMALGKRLQKMGFTCLWVSRLRQKLCRVWTPFPHEVEHCRGRNP